MTQVRAEDSMVFLFYKGYDLLPKALYHLPASGSKLTGGV